MYSTKTATTSATEFVGNYIPAGINENITLKEVNVNRTQNGRDFIEFIFENELGQTATMTEWKNEKNMWIKTDEELQNRDNQQFGRILQIMDCYFETRPEFEASSFYEMINWVKKTLDSVSEKDKQPLRLKVNYDKKGYTRVSSYGIFVEPMSVEESQIKLWKNDLLERPIVADVEPAADPLAGQTMSDFSTPVTETSTGADDLPF